MNKDLKPNPPFILSSGDIVTLENILKGADQICSNSKINKQELEGLQEILRGLDKSEEKKKGR